MTENDQATGQLTPKQELLISCLLSGLSISAAALAAGIGDKTARRWLKQDGFQAAYKDAQRQIFDASLNTLCLGMEDALRALQRHISASVEPTAATQIAAARLWTEQAINVVNWVKHAKFLR